MKIYTSKTSFDRYCEWEQYADLVMAFKKQESDIRAFQKEINDLKEYRHYFYDRDKTVSKLNEDIKLYKQSEVWFNNEIQKHVGSFTQLAHENDKLKAEEVSYLERIGRLQFEAENYKEKIAELEEDVSQLEDRVLMERELKHKFFLLKNNYLEEKRNLEIKLQAVEGSHAKLAEEFHELQESNQILNGKFLDKLQLIESLKESINNSQKNSIPSLMSALHNENEDLCRQLYEKDQIIKEYFAQSLEWAYAPLREVTNLEKINKLQEELKYSNNQIVLAVRRNDLIVRENEILHSDNKRLLANNNVQLISVTELREENDRLKIQYDLSCKIAALYAVQRDQLINAIHIFKETLCNYRNPFEVSPIPTEVYVMVFKLVKEAEDIYD